MDNASEHNWIYFGEGIDDIQVLKGPLIDNGIFRLPFKTDKKYLVWAGVDDSGCLLVDEVSIDVSDSVTILSSEPCSSNEVPVLCKGYLTYYVDDDPLYTEEEFIVYFPGDQLKDINEGDTVDLSPEQQERLCRDNAYSFKDYFIIAAVLSDGVTCQTMSYDDIQALFDKDFIPAERITCDLRIAEDTWQVRPVEHQVTLEGRLIASLLDPISEKDPLLLANVMDSTVLKELLDCECDDAYEFTMLCNKYPEVLDEKVVAKAKEILKACGRLGKTLRLYETFDKVPYVLWEKSDYAVALEFADIPVTEENVALLEGACDWEAWKDSAISDGWEYFMTPAINSLIDNGKLKKSSETVSKE